MPDQGEPFSRELGLIRCYRTAVSSCSICSAKWRSGSCCPRGHQDGMSYYLKEVGAQKKIRKVRCESFGRRCNICGSSVDEGGVCNNQHMTGEWYPL